MPLFDTHCHLNFEIFQPDVDEVIARAQAAGVAEMVIVGTTLANSRLAIEIAARYSGVYAAVGVHPHKLFSYLRQSIEQTSVLVKAELERLVTQPGVVAIGEIGFDRWQYPGTSYVGYQVSEQFLDLQRALFATQLDVAYAAQLPVIFHNRLAGTDLLQGIEDWWMGDGSRQDFLKSKAIFHCCEPNPQLLAFARQHQFMIGVAGNVTTDTTIEDFAQQIPSELLLLETDAPFFKPQTESPKGQSSHQAKANRCEPSNLLKTAQKLAEIRGETVSTLIEQTTANAHTLLGI